MNIFGEEDTTELIISKEAEPLMKDNTLPTPVERKTERKRKPWVYKSEYDKIKKERDMFRNAFMFSIAVIAGIIAAQFGRYIIDLILSV